MLWLLKRKKYMIVRFGTSWFIASQLRSRYANYCSHSKLLFIHKYHSIFLQRNLLTILFIWLESQVGAHVSGIVLYSRQNKGTLVGRATCMSTLTSNHERMRAYPGLLMTSVLIFKTNSGNLQFTDIPFGSVIHCKTILSTEMIAWGDIFACVNDLKLVFDIPFWTNLQ
jgi:hypothetical protein